MTHDARERLTVAALIGTFIGILYATWTHNPLAVIAGVVIAMAIEVFHLSLRARSRRRARPVVREPRVSHIVSINPEDRRRTA